LVATLEGPRGLLEALAFSPDGKLLAAGSLAVSFVLKPAEPDLLTGWLQVWEVATRKVIHTYRPNGAGPVRVAYSPDGKWLASSGLDGTICVWDVATGAARPTFTGLMKNLGGLAFSHDSRLLAGIGVKRALQVWNVNTGELRCTLPGGSEDPMGLVFTRDGRLVVGDRIGDITAWDVDAGRMDSSFRGRVNGLFDLAVTADGRAIAAACSDTTVRILDPATGREMRIYRGSPKAIRRVAYSSDGRRIVALDDNGHLKVWDATQSQEFRIVQSPFERKSSMGFAYSPNGRFIASASFTKPVALWDGIDTTWRHLAGVPVFPQIAFSTDGTRLVVCGNDVTFWDTTSRQKLSVTPLPRWFVTGLALSPDGRHVAASGGLGGGTPGGVAIWEAETGRLVRTCTASSNGHTEAVAFTPDGRLVAAIDSNRRATVWNSESGKLVHAFGANSTGDRALALSSDGRFLAAASAATAVSIWELEAGREVHKIPIIRELRGLAFSADGRRLAGVLAGPDPRNSELKLWDAETEQELLSLTVPVTRLTHPFFHPDGKWLSASASNELFFWDAELPSRSVSTTP
jgi:WD40 repeat protein